jgi:Leucine-rich repeat (LRR) protein
LNGWKRYTPKQGLEPVVREKQQACSRGRINQAHLLGTSLNIQNPPIDKLETSVLSTLTRVEKLSISSNCIDKIVNFPPLKYITRLSLARNNIKKISGLEEIAGTLKELWLSYNQVEKL